MNSPDSLNFVPVCDPVQVQAETERVSKLLDTKTMLSEYCISALRWTIVPVESTSHLASSDITLLLKAICAEGTDRANVFVTDNLKGVNTYYRLRISASGLTEFDNQLSMFNAIIVPADFSFGVLCTVEDYYLIGGSKRFVQDAVGGDIKLARQQFEDFAADDQWDQSSREFLMSISNRYSMT